MKKLRAVAVKEIRQVLRDPLTLVMMLGMPGLMLVLYGFALNFDVRHVQLAVQDEDRSAASRELIATFVNSTYFDVVATPEPGADLSALTERRVAKAVLVIPHGYGDALKGGGHAAVQLLLDGADSTTASTILGYASTLISDLNSEELRRTLLAGGDRRAPPVIAYEPRVWYNPELRSTQFLVPGLIGYLLMLTAVLSTALSVVREKERGTMEQLRVAPLRTAELILGKTLPYLVISLLTAVVILGTARVLFDVRVRGSYLALFAATLLYLVGALAFGIFISTVAESQAIAFQMGMLTSLLPAILLSGFLFQIRTMPGWLQAVTHLVPARYYLVILRGIILKGSGLGPYLDQMGFLALFALFFMGLASVRLAREAA